MAKPKTEAEWRSCYRRVLGTPDGLHVLQDLASFCNVGAALPAGFPDAALRDVEGMRRVFWYVYTRSRLTSRRKRAPIDGDFDPILQDLGEQEDDA